MELEENDLKLRKKITEEYSNRLTKKDLKEVLNRFDIKNYNIINTNNKLIIEYSKENDKQSIVECNLYLEPLIPAYIELVFKEKD